MVAVANVISYGAVGNGSTDDSVSVQAAATAATGGVLYFPSNRIYRIAAPVSIPAGTTVVGPGATIKPALQGWLATGGDRVTFKQLLFDFSADSGLTGGERALAINHAKFLVDRCRFLGNGFRYGIMVIHATGGSCDDGEISNCEFDTTSYATFIQGNTGTSYNRLLIHHNKYRHIRRGDAIQLNVGDSVDIDIRHNDIDDVTANGAANAGMGIGIAGGGYGGAEATQNRHFTIRNNIIKNTDLCAIHTEACNNYVISRNLVVQEGAKIGTSVGIITYGSVGGTVEDNTAIGFSTGINDEHGTVAGSYVLSSDATVIRNNRAKSCVIGIYSGMSGNDHYTHIDDNIVESCVVGIQQIGVGILRFRRNTMMDCTTPMLLNLNYPAKAAVNATTTRRVEIRGNRTYTSTGAAQPSSNSYTNMTVEELLESDNTFSVGLPLSTSATRGFLYVPTCAGTPSGTPADTPSGVVPLIFDTTNNKLYVYDGSWLGGTAPGVFS